MNKTITTIAVTGGPCGGKSSLLTHVDRQLSRDGYRVFSIPESATELILGGIKPFDGCMSMYEFQKFLFRMQFDKEALFHAAARIVPEDHIVIVCDRGIPDNKAYVSDEEFQSLLALFGKTEEEVRRAYDAVIHMVTTADGAEESYTLSNNLARTETLEQARALDRRAQRAWEGHENLFVIDNSTGFDEKIQHAMDCIRTVLRQPVLSGTR